MPSSYAPSALLQHVQFATAELVSLGDSLDDETRKRSLEAAKDLVAALQKPRETIMHYAYHLGAQRMAIRVAIDLGLFRITALADGKPVTATKLAEKTKGEKLLIVRLMRVLSGIKHVKEVGLETYAANNLTKAMADPVTEGSVKICYDLPSWLEVRMHDYFRETGYKSPVDHLNGPLQWTLNTKIDYFEFINSDEERLTSFNMLMTRIRSTRKHWTEWYPVESEILEGLPDDGSMALIDVGGAKGHDLEIFLDRYPCAHGRLMLQDLPGTINSIDSLKDGIKAVAHEFYTPQPEKGARAYYMHFVLHDWSDDKCREILRQIMPAMRPGYSKILINEAVLPDTGCPPEFAAADINMMSILGGMERSRAHWIELCESVGLQVIAVRTSPFEDDVEGVVEAVLRTE